MTRLSSYSRYFSTATPMQMGRAAVPRITTASSPPTDYPSPGTFFHHELGDEHTNDQRDHKDGRTAVEPFQLLAVLALACR